MERRRRWTDGGIKRDRGGSGGGTEGAAVRSSACARRPGAGHHPRGRTGGGEARGSPGSGGGRAAGAGGGLASTRTAAGRPLPQPGGPGGGGKASGAASLGPPCPARFSWSGRGGPGGRRAVAAGGSARPWVPAGARGRPRRHADFTSAPGNSREVGVVSLSQMRDAARCPGHRMERAPGRKQRGRVST